MAANYFAKNSLGWQIQQLQQRFSEWVEFQLFNDPPDIPLGSFPSLPGWVAKLALLLMVALAVGWLCWLGVQLVLPELRGWLSQRQSPAQSLASLQKTPGAAVWLRRSREWQRQGNYNEACRALYMAMLERLHETQQVPHNLSRTDGEYRECVRYLPQPQSYQFLITVHEQLCFGNAAISAEVFQRCQRAYQAIERQ